MESSDYIYGLRAIIEAIREGRQIDKVFIKKDLQGDLAAELFAEMREHGIQSRRVPVEKLNRMCRRNHQGAIAMIAAVPYHNLGNLVATLYEDGVLPFIVVLDGITDVRNFGAIARTAECCGVNGIVIAGRGSVSVGADAVKTSAGALMSLPVCRENSLPSAVKFLRESGFKVVAVSEKADANYTLADYTGPVALVMGAEDVGISPAVMDLCDTRVSIPMFGHIGSLNVSVAAGVMMYEVVRQRLNADLEVI